LNAGEEEGCQEEGCEEEVRKLRIGHVLRGRSDNRAALVHSSGAPLATPIRAV